jgi:hypothetical protein
MHRTRGGIGVLLATLMTLTGVFAGPAGPSQAATSAAPYCDLFLAVPFQTGTPFVVQGQAQASCYPIASAVRLRLSIDTPAGIFALKIGNATNKTHFFFSVSKTCSPGVYWSRAVLDATVQGVAIHKELVSASTRITCS